jgi:hypothetical protein
MFGFVLFLIVMLFPSLLLLNYFVLVLKKSQKEASILVQNSSRGKEIDVRGLGISNKVSKLESDLTGHWKSLFLHMEDIFVNESSHLVSATFVSYDLVT